MNSSIAFYLSHDANVCICINGKYRLYELERLTKERYYRLDNKDNWKEILTKLSEIIFSEYGRIDFTTAYFLELSQEIKEFLTNLFNIQEWIFVGHHLAHAACSFYQSNFDNALVISMDGGGFDGISEEDRVSSFNFYKANREKGIERIKKIDLDLGTPYGLMALPISEIKKSNPWGNNFLAYAGKLMGLVGYGKVREEWLKPIEEFYTHIHKHLVEDRFIELGKKLNLDLSINSLSGQSSYDFASTSQEVFQNLAWCEVVKILSSKDIKLGAKNICLTGGCALNVIFNQLLLSKFDIKGDDIFVPPNPSDCGLSFGMIALHNKPKESINLMYGGFGILDIEILPEKVKEYKAKTVNLKEVVELLDIGNIIGIIQGNSECGPRALGHRSILCNPYFFEMKDILNTKIKHREWFRPFAPVIQEEEVNKYFEFNRDSSFMSFAPRVKDEFKDLIPSVVHIDGTARVQTIKRKDNSFLWELLETFASIRSRDLPPILLNTSFNIKGKPIITTISDALEILETTEMDYLIIEYFLFEKRKNN